MDDDGDDDDDDDDDDDGDDDYDDGDDDSDGHDDGDYDYDDGSFFCSGYFIFTEASHPAEKGDKAGLFSKMVNATENNCLSFWYHMHGPKMGSLRVFVKTKVGVKTLVWNKTGDHGNKWILADVEISTRGLYQVILLNS